MKIEDKLKEMGISVPEAIKPIAEYIPAKKVDNLVYCSGQGPVKDGKFIYIGRVDEEVSLDDGYEAARICAINCLAAIKSVIGSLDKIEEIINLRGFVSSSLDFYRQPEVINGASELIVKIFGEKGKHTRCALGTSVLPGNIPVELEMVVKVK
jgi:enamine deaminase RidA (YjgF/YER057c/UK114 family)